MATRMQQRRGTAAQWTAANPVLAAGEIGFETDTSKFKMGNGSSNWDALTYFANAADLLAVIDGAPDLLNTLNELSAAIGDDPAFITTVSTNLANHEADTTAVHGITDTALLATLSGQANAIGVAVGNHNDATTSIHGITDTAELATKTYADNKADTTITTHTAVTTSVHGIADTAELATKTYAGGAVTTHGNTTTSVHGIADTAELATKTYADDADTAGLVLAATAADQSIETHNLVTTNVHGIADTSLLATQSYADAAEADAITSADATAAAALSAHNSDTTDVHGITDTANLETTSGAQTKADDAVSAHNSDTTNVHGIADTSLLATTADVAAVTAASLGLGSVDNTSDADKPVSTAQVTAIATAKSEAIAEVTAVIDGAPGALDTLNELAAALGDDANFASTVTASLATKVDSYTPITQKTASYTLSTLDHRDDLIEMESASALTLTIPLNSSIAYPVGTSFDVLQSGAGQVTIAGDSGVTVNATPGLKLRTQWSSATVFKRAENTWVVYGDLTA
jgi:hypothetical protein